MELVRPAPALAAGLALAGCLLAAGVAHAQSAENPPQGYTTIEPGPRRTAPTEGVEGLNLIDREVKVHIRKPDGSGTWPGVVFLHDSMGLSRDMTGMADHLAQLGFYVVAPDLYGGKVALDADKGRELTALMDEEAALASIDALAAHVKGLSEIGDHRVGLVGFDLGGRLALTSAMGSRDVSAVVVVSARPLPDAASLERIGCPILGLFGGADALIPADQIAGFRSALAAARRSGEVKIFDGAGHGFMNAKDPTHHVQASAQAWTALVAFLRENL